MRAFSPNRLIATEPLLFEAKGRRSLMHRSVGLLSRFTGCRSARPLNLSNGVALKTVNRHPAQCPVPATNPWQQLVVTLQARLGAGSRAGSGAAAMFRTMPCSLTDSEDNGVEHLGQGPQGRSARPIRQATCCASRAEFAGSRETPQGTSVHLPLPLECVSLSRDRCAFQSRALVL